MTCLMPSLRLTGADVLTDSGFERRPLGIAAGRILDEHGLPGVDLAGFWVLPGIIDLHGDGFERQVYPRPSAPFPLPAALAATDREAAAHGVTTAYLAQSWSWEGGMRGPDRAEALMAAVQAHRDRALTDLRVQVRAETHMVDAVPRLIAAVERYGVDYVIFNDHLDEGFQMQRSNPDGFSFWARKAGLTEAELAARMEAARRQAKAVPRALCDLAAAFDRLGITYGSHDDPDAETREVYRMIGARVAEFPTSFRAAAAARAGGDPVLMGAPNVVRGGSQAGNVAAVDMIRQGLCDALVSDYHIPALALAVWRLVDDAVLPLEKAWALVSSGPARVLGLADRGHLAPGARADLVIVEQDTREIAATVSGGRLSHLSGRAAARFLAAGDGLRMAAE
jgi:alpha-D-ribose 1-methylphosphonate 5-triphosphate diphosphatase